MAALFTGCYSHKSGPVRVQARDRSLVWSLFPQLVDRKRRSLLRQCKMLVDLGDEGPYGSVLQSLDELTSLISPRKLPSALRKRGQLLRSILLEVTRRVKSMAVAGCTGVAQTLYTELSGHGGLAIFRRLEAAKLASQKALQQPRAQQGGGGQPRGGGGLSRGRGGGRLRSAGSSKDMTNVQCFTCLRYGHVKSRCPGIGADSAPGK